MAVVIRLTRVGRLKSPAYRIAVADSRSPRDGRCIEIIGHYQPLFAETKLEIDEERALHWLGVGALPSSTVRSLLRKKGILKKWHEARAERRKARKVQTTAGPADVPAEVPVPEMPSVGV